MNELVTRLRRIAGEWGSIGDTGTMNREAATEIEHLEAELAESRKKLAQSMGYALKADEQCDELKADLETAKMERLVADHELAAANAKIEAVRAFHIESSCEGVCSHCEWSWPCRTIRALADPAPQESHAGSLAGNPLREENGTTGGSPEDSEC